MTGNGFMTSFKIIFLSILFSIILSVNVFASEGGGVGSASYIGIFLLIAACLLLIAILLRGLKGHDIKGLFRSGKKESAKQDIHSIDVYFTTHPEFNAARFKEKLAELYVETQTAWMKKDMQPFKNYFSTAYFQQIKSQVDRMKELKKTSVIDPMEVLDVTLEGIKTVKGKEHILADIKAKITEYVTDDATGAVVSGNQKKAKLMLYRWELAEITDHEKPADFDWEICGIETISQTYML